MEGDLHSESARHLRNSAIATVVMALVVLATSVWLIWWASQHPTQVIITCPPGYTLRDLHCEETPR
jgi:hypothetical protein